MTEPHTTGIPPLDRLIGGGLTPRTITQFYGEPASGKSTAAIASAVAALRDGGCVIYIDTEGFSTERFRQIAGENTESLAAHLFIYEPADFVEQEAAVADCATTLKKNRDIRLIVVDSFTGLYRAEGGPAGEPQKRLARQMILLLGYAKRYDIPVIVTNQVFMDVDTGTLRGLGGTVLSHLSKVIVRFEKKGVGRRAILEKHRSRPDGESFSFIITEDGMREV
ncbi:DNA repair protein RadB [Methanomicrobiaceae archaeon CYW5]|uniref:DNA repair and recombination protein RadB n=1 Tax=Methanovulcanius yangii TaxID=1789227 RepID=UPI0029CA942E|nr:DNA repair and recombination protein RadB [Methanovulcanius yangii]MBT8507092.1 DNA repair protein RadB [Methanovulcanius yangii]